MSYPAFKQTKQFSLDFDFSQEPQKNRNEIFELMHESQNWFWVEHEGWHLPATKDPHEWCGKWAYRGCLNVNGHKNTECKNKVFIKTYQRSCYRADCEICWKKWLARESNKATQRIEKYERQSKKHVKHIIISVPKWEYGKSKKELSKFARSILFKLGCIGGSMIFHPFRFKKKFKQWYYSPHFHVLGFGWIEAVAENYQKNGWIVKNKGSRNSTFATYYYILNHAGIKNRNHVLVWFGDLSYCKLKLENLDDEKQNCPYCSQKMVEVFYVGETLGKPPDMDMELFENPSDWSSDNSRPYVNMDCLKANQKANDLLKKVMNR